MPSLVDQLSARFMPMLTHMAEQLTQEFPGMKVTTYSGPVGTKTGWHGYDWGVDCYFPNAPEGLADNTCLAADIGHIATEPVINALVGWPVNEQVFSDGQNADRDAIEQAQRELPRLFEALRQSLREVGPSLHIT